jgi:hypothetical protein
LEKRAEQVLPGSGEGGGKRREVAQTMNTHVSKYINENI